MDIEESTREQKVVTLDGETFDKKSLANVVGTLKLHGEWDIGNTHIAEKLRDMGLAKRVPQRDNRDMSISGYKWKGTGGGQLDELYESLTKKYTRYRVKCGRDIFGPWCETDMDDAEEKAKDRKRELEERNPDVTFRITEEEITRVD